MKKCIKQIKSQLLKTISEIDEYKWMFCRNPETDFTRNMKWSFEDAMLSIFHMGCESTGRGINRPRAVKIFRFRKKEGYSDRIIICTAKESDTSGGIPVSVPSGYRICMQTEDL